jgi:hypothetical protein
MRIQGSGSMFGSQGGQGQGSRGEGQWLEVKGQGPRGEGQWSEVKGQGLRGKGQWSEVKGQGPRVGTRK